MNPIVNGIHHVAIRASNFDATVGFYTKTLGFREVMRWGEGNGRAVMLDSGKGNCLEVFAGGTDAPKSEGALLHLAFNCDDIDAAIERVRAAGAQITMEPATVQVDSKPKPASIRLAFFKGRDGEVIELFKLE